MSTIVDCIGLVRTYQSTAGPVRVLKGVDLLVEEGKLVALYGPSGSGKTTLLNLIGALDQPTAGSLIVCGKDLSRLGERGKSALRRKQIGFIFQAYALLPTYTALENIDLALRLPHLGFRERRHRALTALDAVGLGEWADHVPDEMSGGQRKRIAIARALALRPRLLLADEPTGGLNSRTTQRIMSLFKSIAAQQGTTFVIVSHDPLVAEAVDLAYDLHDGKLVQRTDTTISAIAAPAPAIEPRSQPAPEGVLM